ncbi:MAG TPA: hypothetical protein VG265_09625 [Gaiellaceae bacterium]|nr:hypothetical protein [Gaiellaceae bacterium]
MRATRTALAALAVGVVLGGSSCGGSSHLKPLSTLGHLRAAPPAGSPGPELVPIPAAPALAPTASQARLTRSVDGIRCQKNERLVFHIHVHLTLFVNGTQRLLPGSIGIWPPIVGQSKYGQFVVTPANCFSWLSTHFSDGIIHVESPVQRSFVLGEFFDIWGQPLSRTQLGPAHGEVTAIVDGQVWTGDPRQIPLVEHRQIQLEVGPPLVAPESVTWPGSF